MVIIFIGMEIFNHITGSAVDFPLGIMIVLFYPIYKISSLFKSLKNANCTQWLDDLLARLLEKNILKF